MPSRFDVPILATREDLEQFAWARGINQKPEGLIQHGLRLLRGGATVPDEDINEKRKRAERKKLGIETVGGM